MCVPDKASETAEETWMTWLNEDCIIDTMNAHPDPIRPLLTDPKLDKPLIPNMSRGSKTDVLNPVPDAEGSNSSSTESMDMTLYERYECKRCKQQTARRRKRNW